MDLPFRYWGVTNTCKGDGERIKIEFILFAGVLHFVFKVSKESLVETALPTDGIQTAQKDNTSSWDIASEVLGFSPLSALREGLMQKPGAKEMLLGRHNQRPWRRQTETNPATHCLVSILSVVVSNGHRRRVWCRLAEKGEEGMDTTSREGEKKLLYRIRDQINTSLFLVAILPLSKRTNSLVLLLPSLCPLPATGHRCKGATRP